MSGVPENGWYAVLDNEQSGPMELSVLLGAVSDGRASNSTFVWRAGYPEWKRAGEVDGLSDLIATAMEGGEKTTVSPIATSTAADMPEEMTKTVAMDMAAVMAAASDRKADNSATSASAAGGTANSMESLFNDDPQPAQNEGGGFFDVADSSQDAEKVKLYQRRDTSVLFSLDDFGKGNSSLGGTESGKGTFADRTAESGLIDIRAVARKSTTTQDDTGGLFEQSVAPVASSAAFNTRMTARTEPLLVSKKKSGGVPGWAIAVGGLTVAALGAVGALLLTGGDAPPVQPEPVAVAPAVPSQPPAPAVAPTPNPIPAPVAQPAAVQQAAPAVPAPPVAEAAANSGNPESASAVVPNSGAGEEEGVPEESGSTPAGKEQKTVAKSVSKPKTVTPKPAPKKEKVVAKKEPEPEPEPAPAEKSKKASNATALLNSLGSGGGGGAASESAGGGGGGSGQKKLSKSDIRKAVREHTKAVVDCYNSSGASGGSGPVIVTAKLKVATSGSVMGVTVLGALGSGPAGSCISSKLKGAKFPAFDEGPQSVSMTFRVK